MKWIAILLALAGLGGNPTPKAEKPGKRCTTSAQAKKKPHCKKKPAKQPTTKAPAPTKQPTAGTSPNTPAAPRPDDPAAPGATATPGPSATPGATATPVVTATATPTATPVLPRRTSVDLDEWDIHSSYDTLATGRVTFNANNRGEDEHNLAVRGGGREYGQIDLAPGESAPLPLDLAPGNYTLYCSLLGHEAAGMKLAITIK